MTAAESAFTITNLNTATAEEIAANNPEISEALANKIVQFRKDNGKITSVDQLLKINGMNRGILDRSFATVDSNGDVIIKSLNGDDVPSSMKLPMY